MHKFTVYCVKELINACRSVSNYSMFLQQLIKKNELMRNGSLDGKVSIHKK